MPKTLSLLAVLKKIDTKGLKSLSDPQWNTFLASDTEPNEIQEKIKKLEGYENTGAAYDATGELIVEDNNAMIERFRQRTGRAKGRESLKVKKSKINVKSFKEQFLDKDQEPVKPDTTGASDLTTIDKPRALSKADPVEEKETEGLKGIRGVLDDILKVLRLDFKGDRKEARDAQKEAQKDKRDKRESKLEGGVKKSLGVVGKAVASMMKPFKNIWESIINWIKFTLIGVLFQKTLKWFEDPKNQKKAERVGKFFKDWWPALAGAAALFLTPLGALISGMTGLLMGIIPKLVMAIAANPWAAAAVLGGVAIWGISKRIGGKDKSESEEGETAELDTMDTTVAHGGGLIKSPPIQNYNEGGLVPTLEMAGGGLVPGYNKGGKVQSDTSHFGTEGYRMGQRLPEQLYYNLDKYTSSYKTKDGEVVEDKDELIELSGAIGMPDLIEHQKQLVDSIRKVEGYEDINFMDVIQYPDNRGRLVGMPEETLYPIFNASDAWKASDAKRSEAIRMDQDAGTLNLDPTQTAKAVGLNGGGVVHQFGPQMGSFFGGGGLVQYLNNGGSPQEVKGTGGGKSEGEKLVSMDDMVNEFMNGMKQHYGITNTKPHAFTNESGITSIMTQEEVDQMNNEKLPFGMTMTEDGQNIDLGKAAADQLRMIAQVAQDPKYAENLKDHGKKFGFDNLTPEQLQVIANEEADDMQFNVNRFIPGTEAHRLDTVAQDINLSTSQFKPKKFNKGGEVPGTGNKDTVPAMLTPGEFVMSKGAVQKYGSDTMESMNAASAASPTAGSKKNGTVPAMLTPGEFVVSAPAVQEFGVKTLESMNLKGGGNNKPELKSPDENVTAKPQKFNTGGLVEEYKKLRMERSRLQRRPDGTFSRKDKKKWDQLSSEMNSVNRQIMNYDRDDKKSNKSKKAKGIGLGRMLGGAADFLTGNLFDFDKRGSIGDGVKRLTSKEPVETPVPAAKNRVVTLPPVSAGQKGGEDVIPAKSKTEVPQFRVPMISNQRNMVVSSLGIADLMGGA